MCWTYSGFFLEMSWSMDFQFYSGQVWITLIKKKFFYLLIWKNWLKSGVKLFLTDIVDFFFFEKWHEKVERCSDLWTACHTVRIILLAFSFHLFLWYETWGSIMEQKWNETWNETLLSFCLSLPFVLSNSNQIRYFPRPNLWCNCMRNQLFRTTNCDWVILSPVTRFVDKGVAPVFRLAEKINSCICVHFAMHITDVLETWVASWCSLGDTNA